MELGDSVTLEKNGVDYTGTVTEIGSMVNESSGLYDARAMVPDAAGLTNGSRVKMTIIMDRVSQVLNVPGDAATTTVPRLYTSMRTEKRRKPRSKQVSMTMKIWK